MTAQKHTPGPWHVYEQPISGRADAIMELIEQVQATDPVVDNIYLIDAGGKCPATTGCGPTSRANAHLIAAAPDLLDALIGLLAANDAVQSVLCDGPEVPGFDPTALGSAQLRVTEAEDVARAAIAKAEGRP